MVSASDRAKRALVTLIRDLAGVYGVTLDITRHCRDDALRKAYKKLLLKVHPDKGGQAEDQKKLNIAHDDWVEAVKGKPGRGRGAQGARTKPAADERPDPIDDGQDL